MFALLLLVSRSSSPQSLNIWLLKYAHQSNVLRVLLYCAAVLAQPRVWPRLSRL